MRVGARRPGARSAGEQQHLARGMGPWRPGGSSGAAEDAGDVVGVGDDGDDAHPAAARAADGDVDGEHAGEQVGPAEAARSRIGGLGCLAGAVAGSAGEAERELLTGRGDDGRRNDARAKMMAIGEDAVVTRLMKARRRDEGAQACEELVGRHVGVRGPAAPGGLEEHADPAVRERLDGVVGEGRAQ